MNTEKVFITGASSGIGEHLAYAYARRGATIGLAARRIDRLSEIAGKCRELGGKTFTYELDVCDEEAGKRVAQ
ncbi:MAG: SDR family NAD(P)-dependent oxidoreductase, partial [FCB group bacterium]|nr:SDR family NAD(P)-dependent oxidoreductase [FCB group bacterium]